MNSIQSNGNDSNQNNQMNTMIEMNQNNQSDFIKIEQITTQLKRLHVFGEIFAETVIWVIKKQPCGVQGCLISSVKMIT